MNWKEKIYESLTESQFKERPGWSKKAPKPKNKWAPHGRDKYSKKGQESRKASARNWSEKDPEGVDPKNPRRGMAPTIHASGSRSRSTGEPIKKRR